MLLSICLKLPDYLPPRRRVDCGVSIIDGTCLSGSKLYTSIGYSSRPFKTRSGSGTIVLVVKCFTVTGQKAPRRICLRIWLIQWSQKPYSDQVLQAPVV
jgi:hypothetical protein